MPAVNSTINTTIDAAHWTTVISTFRPAFYSTINATIDSTFLQSYWTTIDATIDATV